MGRLLRWLIPRCATGDCVTTAPVALIGGQTTEYLENLAFEAFKRQSELDESVWRSLPFFVAASGVAIALVGRSASDLPPLAYNFYAVATHLLLVACVLCFCWAFRWFCVLLARRGYEFPADVERVQSYGRELGAFHRGEGLEESDVDAAVLSDLREFMIDQYATAARTNFRHNAARMDARNQVLLFMLIGFGLAFCCMTLIFIEKAVIEAPTVANGGQQNEPTDNSPDTDVATPAAADAPAATSAYEGRAVQQGQLGAPDQGKVVAKPPPAPPAKPAKPAPPPTQTIYKNQDPKPRPTTKG